MTNSDLEEIERKLALTLPGYYKAAVLQFPFPAYAGTSQFSLSDDPAFVIRGTIRAREFSRADDSPFLVIGDDQDGQPYFLDLRTSRVVKARFFNDSQAIEQFAGFEEFLQDLRRDYSGIANSNVEREFEIKYGALIGWGIFALIVGVLVCVLAVLANFD